MITKIQSFTDVITNSSSTVFVMHEDDARYYERLENAEGCIDIQPITMEWLQENRGRRCRRVPGSGRERGWRIQKD